MKRVGILFPGEGDTAMVDYVRMSQDLKLHYSSLNYVSARVNKVENLKEILAKSSGKTNDLNK